ncbi:MAG: RHS repeat-associated core domain-containing protein, partial [Lysobacteraceae bacterium]
PGLSLGYEFDAVGNLAVLRNGKQVDTLRTYHYDGLNRLVEARDAQEDLWQSYNYDRTGSRTTSGRRDTVNMQDCTGTAPGEPCIPLPPSTQWTTRTYTYKANTHNLWTVGNTERTHDSAGNLTRIGPMSAIVVDPLPGDPPEESASYGGTVPTESIGTDDGSEVPPGVEIKTFDYDTANRMRSVSVYGEVMMSYRYNGKGERVYRNGNGDTVHTLYDEAGHWIGDYDVNGTVIQQAIWFDGLPVGVLAKIGSSLKLHYVEADALGTPRAVIDPVRDLAVWRWDLTNEAFGESEPNMDPDNDGQGFVFDMRYPGQQFDSATGLNYNYFRDYDPSVGRYVQSDPIGLESGTNTYGYVRGNPMARIDPDGLRDIIVAIWLDRALSGQVGHVFVGELDGTVLTSQFPATHTTRDSNRTLDWDMSLAEERREPDAVFRVYVPDDVGFNAAASMVRVRPLWDWLPDGRKGETNCVVGANEALAAGGAPHMLMQPALPRDLYNLLRQRAINHRNFGPGVTQLDRVPWGRR